MLLASRKSYEEFFLDKLIISAIIEARGCERFALLAKNLEDHELKTFYLELSRRERGHYQVFLNIARKYFTKEEVELALERMVEIESKAVKESPLTYRLH